MINFTKEDDNRIRVEKTEIVERSISYEYEFLVKQRESIIAQKDRDNARRDLELAEIDTLLTECVKLGIGPKIDVI